MVILLILVAPTGSPTFEIWCDISIMDLECFKVDGRTENIHFLMYVIAHIWRKVSLFVLVPDPKTLSYSINILGMVPPTACGWDARAGYLDR